MREPRVSKYANRNPAGVGLYQRIKLNSVVERFPLSWRTRLFDSIGRLDNQTYDLWHERVSMLVDAERGGLRPDAGDADICQVAQTTSDDFARRLKLAGVVAAGDGWGDEWVEAFQALTARQLLDARGMSSFYPCGPGVTRGGVLKRLECPKWWRRTLRKLHARTVEACAVGIGLVSQAAGLYASDEAVKRRAGQNARNAAALESVTAVNDLMQSRTLAQLAATGTANKSIRRVELLTRIAGFELLSKKSGHVGYMVTVTCPSRFHRKTTKDGRVFDNRKYDGSTADDGQSYLSAAWARCRSAAVRAGLIWYGFRIAEPQHDGTPHWHSLLFFAPLTVDVVTERVNKKGELVRKVKPGGADAVAVMQSLVRRYFLDADSPNEPGAQKHRVDFEWINPAKGSAVGYVIKYVSKNIDGHGVGLDLFGGDAITSSARVEAWASTWRIRQFQQIGGAPVGVWRELRRVNPDDLSDTAPDALRVALSAVNAAKTEPGIQSIAWMRYTNAQGGIGTKRKCLRLRLMREDVDGLGRYGEDRPRKLIGVDAEGVQLFKNHVHAMRPGTPAFSRPSFASIESERCTWVVTHGGEAAALDAARVVFSRIGEAERTRIHVNNCTARDLSRVSEFAPVREYRSRTRKFVNRGGAEGPKVKQQNDNRRTDPGPGPGFNPGPGPGLDASTRADRYRARCDESNPF